MCSQTEFAAKLGQEYCSICPSSLLLMRYLKSSFDLDELAFLVFVYNWVCSLFLHGSQQPWWPSPRTCVPGLDHISLRFSLQLGFMHRNPFGDPQILLLCVPVVAESVSAHPLYQPMHLPVGASAWSIPSWAPACMWTGRWFSLAHIGLDSDCLTYTSRYCGLVRAAPKMPFLAHPQL